MVRNKVAYRMLCNGKHIFPLYMRSRDQSHYFDFIFQGGMCLSQPKLALPVIVEVASPHKYFGTPFVITKPRQHQVTVYFSSQLSHFIERYKHKIFDEQLSFKQVTMVEGKKLPSIICSKNLKFSLKLIFNLSMEGLEHFGCFKFLFKANLTSMIIYKIKKPPCPDTLITCEGP